MQTHSCCSISTSDMWQTQLQGLLLVCFQELKSLASQPEAWKFDKLVFIFCDNISWTRLHVFQSFTWLKAANQAFSCCCSIFECINFLIGSSDLIRRFLKNHSHMIKRVVLIKVREALQVEGKPQDLAQLHESHLGVVLKTPNTEHTMSIPHSNTCHEFPPLKPAFVFVFLILSQSRDGSYHHLYRSRQSDHPELPSSHPPADCYHSSAGPHGTTPAAC